jgi:glycosyltransferase involved in cell wall biosynthesis
MILGDRSTFLSPLALRNDVLSWSESRPAPGSPLVRVLHIINGEDYAGAERVQDTLAERLPDYGYEVGFACLKSGRFAQARRSRRSPVYDMPMRTKFDLSPIRHLAAVVHKDDYRMVHSHTPRTALIGAAVARRAGVPLVHHVHCQTAVEVGWRRWQDMFNLLLERLVTCRAAHVVAVSPSLHRYLLRRGYSNGQLRLVANGVPSEEVHAVARKPGRVPTVGMIALFRPRKGLEVLLRSLAVLRERGCHVRLRGVGRFQSPAYERDVKQLASELNLGGLIEWTGFRADVAAELAEVDALILPSLVSEAMPMSLLEAMAAGVPVIGSRVDGITDLIDDQMDGLLVPPADAVALAEAIGQIVNGGADAERLRTNAQRKQRQRYSDHSMAAGVARIYDEVLAR